LPVLNSLAITRISLEADDDKQDLPLLIGAIGCRFNQRSNTGKQQTEIRALA
jgi:hypothetical protein